MSNKIEWTDESWNPVRGCSIVSKGCTNCYAMKQAHRFHGRGQPYEGLTKLTNGGPIWTDKIKLVPELLDRPFHWKKPRRVFVNSMSDLFHEDVPDEFLADIFRVMAQSQQHIFQVLTKRPERMKEWCDIFKDRIYGDVTLPLPNVWLGVSVENQKTADERIPLLLQTPAAVRWISAEPLLGAIDLMSKGFLEANESTLIDSGAHDPINWVVTGGESGHKARPSHPGWFRSLRDQCVAANVPFFFKQFGEYRPHTSYIEGQKIPGNMVVVSNNDSDWLMQRVGKKVAGRTLDGETWDQYPHG